MLEIVVPAKEFYDEATNRFTKSKAQILQLEHSLISIYKWEAKWHKAFLGKEPRTDEESLDYVRCMTINKGVDELTYLSITHALSDQIKSYIEDTMTATKFFGDKDGPTNKDTITAELIYYWMIELHIPMEFEKRHLNQLLTLIHVCNFKNGPQKKMPRKETRSRNKAINDARRKQLNTTG